MHIELPNVAVSEEGVVFSDEQKDFPMLLLNRDVGPDAGAHSSMMIPSCPPSTALSHDSEWSASLPSRHSQSVPPPLRLRPSRASSRLTSIRTRLRAFIRLALVHDWSAKCLIRLVGGDGLEPPTLSV
jgi:hypothetical protein